jgi:hypothetical protein
MDSNKGKLKRHEAEGENKQPKKKVSKSTPIEELVDEEMSLDYSGPTDLTWPQPSKYANPMYDFSFKKLFATETNKSLLISVLNAILDLKIRDVTLKNTFSQRDLSILDVFVKMKRRINLLSKFKEQILNLKRVSKIMIKRIHFGHQMSMKNGSRLTRRQTSSQFK